MSLLVLSTGILYNCDVSTFMSCTPFSIHFSKHYNAFVILSLAWSIMFNGFIYTTRVEVNFSLPFLILFIEWYLQMHTIQKAGFHNPIPYLMANDISYNFCYVWEHLKGQSGFWWFFLTILHNILSRENT